MDRHPLKLLRLTALMLCVMQWPSAFAQDKPRSLYDGASIVFEQAQVIKPRENAAFGPAHALAPLIVQEVRESSSRAPARSHSVRVPSKASQAESTLAQVFFEPGTIVRDGERYEQMTYWWFQDQWQPSPGRQRTSEPVFKGGARLLMQLKSPSAAGRSAPAEFQGVRLTMNAGRVPVIYEVLETDQNIGKIFVTQSIEAAAVAKFGPALPGRRHAVERSLSEAPGVVVPRVIDDPPDFMGPILYLSAETHDVATLICRCMNAQVKALAGQGLYELVPGNFTEALGNRNGNPLSNGLRLPARL